MSAATNIVQDAITTSTSNTGITYAPYITPVSGTYKLVGVALKWQDNPGPSLQSVSNATKATAEVYKNLSKGQFIFEPVSYEIAVPYKHEGGNLLHATNYAKNLLEQQHGIPVNGKNITYVMVTNNLTGSSFTKEGGNTSNPLDTLTTTFCHEVGRTTPLVLGSSGAFKQGKYADQADGTTFMSHFASSNLTASQLYYLGWLPNTQVALYNANGATAEYTLAPLNADNSTGLKAVLITGAANKALFLSRPTLKDGQFRNGNGKIVNTLHLASSNNNRGSERVTVFGKTVDYNGLSFDEVSVSAADSTAVISISPAPQTKPHPKL